MNSYVCITGAAGGLGKAFAAECAERGWDLLITDINAALLPPLANGLSRMYNVEVRQVACDLTCPEGREILWQYVVENQIKFHMFINVAGVDFEGRFNQRSLDELRTIIRLNIEATMELTHNSLRHRDPVRTLRIINVSSLASFYPMPVKAVYAASKRFLLDFSRALNKELRQEDVSVTALCPAGLPTTPKIIEKINVQGFMGQITTMNVGDVAAKTIRAALSGREVYVPGQLNQFLRLLGNLTPPTVVAEFINKRWSDSNQKSATITTAQIESQIAAF